MEKHQKHTKLAKPNYGNFGRNEWAILGTPCGVIQELARELSKILPPQYSTAYIDADHKSKEESEELPYFLEYTDKISYNRFDIQGKITPFQHRSFFNNTDLILINGNHFEGKRQILVLDERKYDSLNRKLNRLTQVDMFLTENTEGVKIPDFLKNYLPNWAEIPIYNINDKANIINHILTNISVTPLQSLILVGGKSTRMGRDKAQIDYHGKPQWEHVRSLINDVRLDNKTDIFISCRFEQQENFDGVKLIVDTFLELGPFGAILSAFRENPNAAWLVIACDLPLLDKKTIDYLILNRNPSKIATTFKSPESSEGFPEPLITIWEPKAYPILLQFLAQGISCPRKVLINSDVELLEAPNPQTLMNVNTLSEFDDIQKIISTNNLVS